MGEIKNSVNILKMIKNTNFDDAKSISFSLKILSFQNGVVLNFFVLK